MAEVLSPGGRVEMFVRSGPKAALKAAAQALAVPLVSASDCGNLPFPQLLTLSLGNNALEYSRGGTDLAYYTGVTDLATICDDLLMAMHLAKVVKGAGHAPVAFACLSTLRGSFTPMVSMSSVWDNNAIYSLLIEGSWSESRDCRSMPDDDRLPETTREEIRQTLAGSTASDLTQAVCQTVMDLYGELDKAAKDCRKAGGGGGRGGNARGASDLLGGILSAILAGGKPPPFPDLGTRPNPGGIN